MKTNPTVLERLYNVLISHQTQVLHQANSLSDLAQDMEYLREELEQLIDQERYNNNV